MARRKPWCAGQRPTPHQRRNGNMSLSFVHDAPTQRAMFGLGAITHVADVPAHLGETVITLTNIAPGTYAIETFQDINSNHRMDTSWFGFPLEPFGFSRDARPHFSKPQFAQVKFDLVPGVNSQILHLQNSVSLIASK